MNSEEAYELMTRYALVAKTALIRGEDDPTFEEDNYTSLTYLTDMIDRASPEFDEDKANRWVGFMQGVLWAERIFDLESLKAHVKAAKNLVEKVHTEDCQGAVLEDRCV